jgi:hypothetical protein
MKFRESARCSPPLTNRAPSRKTCLWQLGRPAAQPTQAEARAAALEELVPAAVKSLRAHLGEGDPVAWRAALRVFELSYGKPAESVELDLDVVDPLHVAEMTPAERAQLVARVLEVHPHLAELVPLHLRAVAEVEEGHPLEPE